MTTIKSIKDAIRQIKIPETMKTSVAARVIELEAMEDCVSMQTIDSIDGLRASLDSIESDDKYTVLHILNEFSEEVDCIILERYAPSVKEKKAA